MCIALPHNKSIHRKYTHHNWRSCNLIYSQNMRPMKWIVLLICCVFLPKHSNSKQKNLICIITKTKYLIGYICLLWMIFTYRIHLSSKYVWLTQSNPSRQTHYEKFSFRLRNTKGGSSWEQKHNKPHNRSFCIFSAGATRKWRL